MRQANFKYIVCTLTFFFVLSITPSLHAALRIWDGDGGANTNWNFPANWANDIPPGSSDDVMIPTGFTVTVAANASAQSILIQGTSTLMVESGVTLSIDHGAPSFGISLMGTSSLENEGIILIDDASTNGILVLGGSSLDNLGTITIIDNDGTAGDAAIVIEDGQVDNAGTISGSDFANLISYSGTSGSFNNNAGGTLQGGGDVDTDVFNGNGGAILPGIPGTPGIMNFIGNVDLSNTAIQIELSAAGMAGTDYGQIACQGELTLNGTATLEVVWIGMGNPANGNAFTLVTATTQVVGSFAMSPTLPACCTWLFDDNGGLGPITLQVDVFLPVELLGFSGEARLGEVDLFWKTGSEQLNMGWEVEHSIDGQAWNSVGFVAGAGNSTVPHHYKFVHHSPSPNHNYYRLRQIDWDGNSEFSPVISVDGPALDRSESIKVYPNPAQPTGTLTINVPDSNNSERVLKVYHLDGRLIYQTAVTANNIIFRYAGWAEGLYLFALENGDSVEIFQVFVSRN